MYTDINTEFLVKVLLKNREYLEHPYHMKKIIAFLCVYLGHLLNFFLFKEF